LPCLIDHRLEQLGYYLAVHRTPTLRANPSGISKPDTDATLRRGVKRRLPPLACGASMPAAGPVLP
jgi:hypothetical protein